MRRTGRCSRCGGERIGLLEQLVDASDAGPSYRAVGLMHYRVAVLDRGGYGAWQRTRRPRPPREVGPTTITKTGTIEACVCRDCGRLELYLQDPQWCELERLAEFCWVADLPDDRGSEMNTCEKCRSTKVGHLSSLPDTWRSEQEVAHQHVGLVRDADGSQRAAGRIAAYVCTHCGYLQLYVADAPSTPFERMASFTPLGSGGSPYR